MEALQRAAARRSLKQKMCGGHGSLARSSGGRLHLPLISLIGVESPALDVAKEHISCAQGEAKRGNDVKPDAGTLAPASVGGSSKSERKFDVKSSTPRHPIKISEDDPQTLSPCVESSTAKHDTCCAVLHQLTSTSKHVRNCSVVWRMTTTVKLQTLPSCHKAKCRVQKL